MMMQRTSQAVSYIHALKGCQSFPYIDDFGGGETNYHESNNALRMLQQILHDLGLAEAIKKVCEPNQKNDLARHIVQYSGYDNVHSKREIRFNSG